MTIYLTEEQYKKVLEADEASSEAIDKFLEDTKKYKEVKIWKIFSFFQKIICTIGKNGVFYYVMI